MNAIVLPPAWVTPTHTHERQEELYLVLDGRDRDRPRRHDAHGSARAGWRASDPGTMRSLRNTSDAAEATYFCVGGADGYVGRDGVTPD